VLAATLLVPAAAGATSVSVRDGVISVRGTDGRDDVEVRYGMADGPVIAVRDLYQTVDAGPGCTATIEGATCPYDGSRAVDVALGAGAVVPRGIFRGLELLDAACMMGGEVARCRDVVHDDESS